MDNKTTDEMTMNKLIINQKRSSIFWFLLSSLALVAGSVVIFITYDSILYKIIAVIGVLFFGLGIVLFTKNFINPPELLIIDENGITNKSQGNKLGFIPWEDIKSFSVDKITLGNKGKVNHSLISINLMDEEKYLEKVSGAQRQIMVANKKLNYSVAYINLTGAEKKRDEVKIILDDFLDNYKKLQKE